MLPILTERLHLREFTLADAPFILQLLNEPGWLRFIGDKQVRTVADAEAYLLEGPMRMYARHGFGLWRVALRESDEAIGMCGLIRRDTLEDVDLGFAFLARHEGRGHAFEAASACKAYGHDTLGIARIVAITTPDNVRCARLLRALGMHKTRQLHERTPDGQDEVLDLYA